MGNEFRRDDGLGPAVIRALADRTPGGHRVDAVVAADAVDLLDAWSGADLAIVVDLAMGTPARAGRVRRATSAGVDAVGSIGGHSVDLFTTLELARELGRSPGALVVFTVEGADVRVGIGLSPPVARAVAEVVAAIDTELENWEISESARRRVPDPPGPWPAR
ncbi:hydrogenase maturation protease [Rhodococcus sp. ABRD24]|uniref:hydrogenase maturation protease n=1 Tax=Rhodococcus sp. ABRD24 TaxID=2507582 RepID=UPI001F60311B|nr:hydrogenase maturation protease [Rhodococcus sp. ABRD24]